jgi:hypothetical protein
MGYYVHPAGPAPPADALTRGRQLFERFHCFAPDRMLPARVERPSPQTLVRIGRLVGLIYRSDRGQRGRERTFVHFMEEPPMLAANAQGTQLFVIGGRYRVTARGLEG